MSLSNEDSLRLNVLLHQDLRAIRIDESAMIVHALTGKGEAKVKLVPNVRDDLYLRVVRELLSTHALGSPGGYPVFLKRWTRMSQMRENNLDRLLILGEPEAVVAVAHARGISEQLARYTWWAMPTADIARRLLESKAVAQSAFAKELANYLLEYMPFETEALAIIENVRLILQPNLISNDMRQELWDRAGRKTMYYVGFLLALPDYLPEQSVEHPLLSREQKQLSALLAQGNPYARQLARLLSAPGQSYLRTLDKAFARLSNQDMTVSLLKAVENYFDPFFEPLLLERFRGVRETMEIQRHVDQRMDKTKSDETELLQMIEQLPQCVSQIAAMLSLSMVEESIVNPVFAQTDAMGSVMRKKLDPVVAPIRQYIGQLLV